MKLKTTDKRLAFYLCNIASSLTCAVESFTIKGFVTTKQFILSFLLFLLMIVLNSIGLALTAMKISLDGIIFSVINLVLSFFLLFFYTPSTYTIRDRIMHLGLVIYMNFMTLVANFWFFIDARKKITKKR